MNAAAHQFPNISAIIRINPNEKINIAIIRTISMTNRTRTIAAPSERHVTTRFLKASAFVFRYLTNIEDRRPIRLCPDSITIPPGPAESHPILP